MVPYASSCRDVSSDSWSLRRRLASWFTILLTMKDIENTLCISFPLWNIVKPRGGYLWIRHQCDNLHCTSQSHTKVPQATVWQGTMKRSWGYVMVRGSARLLFQTWASVGCELTAQDHFFISRWRPMSSSGWQKPWGPVMLPSFWQDSCLGCHFKFYDTCLNHL